MQKGKQEVGENFFVILLRNSIENRKLLIKEARQFTVIYTKMFSCFLLFFFVCLLQHKSRFIVCTQLLSP